MEPPLSAYPQEDAWGVTLIESLQVWRVAVQLQVEVLLEVVLLLLLLLLLAAAVVVWVFAQLCFLATMAVMRMSTILEADNPRDVS